MILCFPDLQLVMETLFSLCISDSFWLDERDYEFYSVILTIRGRLLTEQMMNATVEDIEQSPRAREGWLSKNNCASIWIKALQLLWLTFMTLLNYFANKNIKEKTLILKTLRDNAFAQSYKHSVISVGCSKCCCYANCSDSVDFFMLNWFVQEWTCDSLKNLNLLVF